MDDYLKSLAEYLKTHVKPGDKIIIETGNETMHLDLETGEWVSDSFETTNEEWNAPQSPL